MKVLLTSLLCLLSVSLSAQTNYYYPPNDLDTWDTVDPASLGWCTSEMDNLIDFLDEKNSKSFIILKDGKIAVEHYFDAFTRDSIWYWASAGKSLTATLVGMAQQNGLLDIDDSTSHHLGIGWTNASAQQEGQITIRHQLSMNTGLDDNVTDLNCLTPNCLNYLADPEQRWAYYNAPYRLLLDVLESASGQDINAYTNAMLRTSIGLRGGWFNYVRFGRARDMARFGLLILSEGWWNGNQILTDTAYVNAMSRPSQNLNPSYGYLWWLNGRGSYQQPRVQFLFQGDIIPAAPNDMFAALGKNDQKIYVVPSQDLVVIRQGDAADQSVLALGSFDDELWQNINAVICNTATSLSNDLTQPVRIYPNPAHNQLRIETARQIESSRLFNLQGQEIKQFSNETFLYIGDLPTGLYLLEVVIDGQLWREKVLVKTR